MKEIDGVKCEPVERLVIDVPEEYVGAVMEKMGTRKAELSFNAPDRKQNENRISYTVKRPFWI
jgi:predicted membrane GTPase involved in stress response